MSNSPLSSFKPNFSISCPSCGLQYSFENTPKILKNCHHSICLRCLKTEELCPQDNELIQANEYGIRSFLTDTKILEQLKSVKRNKKVDSNLLQISNFNKVSMISTKSDAIENQEEESRDKNSPEKLRMRQNANFERKEKEQHLRSSEKIDQAEEQLRENVCLFHSRELDVICLDEECKCMICSNCALFGQHKGHEVISYEELLQKITKITDDSFKVYESVKDKTKEFNQPSIDKFIEQELRERRTTEVKNIRVMFSKVIEKLRKMEKLAIASLDGLVAKSIKRLQSTIDIQQFETRKQKWFEEVHRTAEVMESVYQKQQLTETLSYIDRKDSRSFLVQNGEYLAVEIAAYEQMIRNIVAQESQNLKCIYQQTQMMEKIESYCTFSPQYSDIVRDVEENKKRMLQSLKQSVTSSFRNPMRKTFQDSNGNRKQSKSDAIQPIGKLQSKTMIKGVEVIEQSPGLKVPISSETQKDDLLLENVDELNLQDVEKKQGCPQSVINELNIAFDKDGCPNPVQESVHKSQTHLQNLDLKRNAENQEQSEIRLSEIPVLVIGSSNHKLQRKEGIRKGASKHKNGEGAHNKTPQRRSGVFSSRSQRDRQPSERSVNSRKTNRDDSTMSPCLEVSNTSYLVERQILKTVNPNTAALSLNSQSGNVSGNNAVSKKKRKIDIPEKYKAVWEDAKNDRSELIDLTGAELGDNAILCLGDALTKSFKVRTLKVIRNKLTDEAAFELFSSLRCSNVTSVNLSQNFLTEKTLDLLEYLDLGNVKTVTLSLNKINARRVKDKIQSFKQRGVVISI